MAKIGAFKPFRGSATSLANIVLEDGEIAFETTNKCIYMGNGVDTISNLSPFLGRSFPQLVSWSTGTDAEIAAMVEGYYDGTFTLQDIQSVWSVGDTRTVSLSAMPAAGYTNMNESHRAQDVELTIVGFEMETLTSPINGKTHALVTLWQKDCLMDAECAAGTKIGMNNTENGFLTGTNAQGLPQPSSTKWSTCARRSWCNSTYKNALPNFLASHIKPVNIKTVYPPNKQLETTSDYVFFLSFVNVVGDNFSGFGDSSQSQEGSQYPYFQTASNRICRPIWNPSDTTQNPYTSGYSYNQTALMMLRSIRSDYDAYQTAILGGDNQAFSTSYPTVTCYYTYYNAQQTYVLNGFGIAPVMCL